MNVVEVKNLQKTINGREVLRDINLFVKQNEIYGLLGKNGAGKTTTIRSILGLIKKDYGYIKIFGEEVEKIDYKRVGVMFDCETFNIDWTIEDNLKSMCYIYGADEQDIFSYIDLLQINQVDLKKKFRHLSKGMKRKVSLISVLLPNPDLLILDEPTSGLDPEMQIVVRNFILQLKKEGKTIIFSSHNLQETQKVCDKVSIVNEGETLVEFPIQKNYHIVKGEFTGLDMYKIKNTDLYIMGDELIKNFGISDYKVVESLEEIYMLAAGGDVVYGK
ncbi:ABC transporter ATP-binding protein [Caloramator proteoclasticus]|uniref:ABC-2 type transport system ATP-binding protein n=1 Tax=Caloramator proteoclasticus DSM 10124 TaxID=1121262 RepID=A0A1M5B598_9CLOT|nr:ABC transporter ATP-binding protein [Caloramator proteoclasticus]SHF37694.1 ABC-2 type transport system ATP-binding protein [Caloramator proteoclasticus DSM 10124]